MNKIKFIMPVIGLAATAGAIVPAAVSCNPDSPEDEIKLTLSDDAIELAPNETKSLTATLEPEDAGELVWEINQDKDNPCIEFDETVKEKNTKTVRALPTAQPSKPAVIYVSLNDHEEVEPVKCVVTIKEVSPEPTKVVITDGDEIELSKTKVQGHQFEAQVYDDKGEEITTGFTLVWTMETESKMELTSDGFLDITEATAGDEATVVVTLNEYPTVNNKIRVSITD